MCVHGTSENLITFEDVHDVQIFMDLTIFCKCSCCGRNKGLSYLIYDTQPQMHTFLHGYSGCMQDDRLVNQKSRGFYLNPIHSFINSHCLYIYIN